MLCHHEMFIQQGWAMECMSSRPWTMIISHVVELVDVKICLKKIQFLAFFNCWKILFPTCQVRVVRFYQSCSPHPPPPRPPPSPPPPSSSSSASSSSSTTSASTSRSTVALPTLGQALRQLRSSVRTAGPQPGTFPAQCAPLDVNLGPS